MKKYELNCLGEACPVPLIRVKKEMEKMEKGDVLLVHVDYACAMQNIPNWAKEEGHPVELVEVNNGEWDITITK